MGSLVNVQCLLYASTACMSWLFLAGQFNAIDGSCFLQIHILPRSHHRLYCVCSVLGGQVKPVSSHLPLGEVSIEKPPF